MEIGDYIRTENGDIGKIINFINEPTDYYFSCYETDLPKNWGDKYITEYANIKSSPNIIDLIEVGDYVNGVEVIGKLDYILEFDGGQDGDWYIRDGEIETVVTKEQFERMEYKL